MKRMLFLVMVLSFVVSVVRSALESNHSTYYSTKGRRS